MAFTLPDLPYPYDALAPHMSRETLEFHHDKHHLAYVNTGNNLAKGTEWENKSVEQRASDIGRLAKVKEDLIQAGVTQFGSGWCWLAVTDGKITIMKTPNGENPLVHGGKPILGCDVWEHSYYIDYRNRRPDYLKAFFDHLVNWEHVAEMFEAAMK